MSLIAAVSFLPPASRRLFLVASLGTGWKGRASALPQKRRREAPSSAQPLSQHVARHRCLATCPHPPHANGRLASCGVRELAPAVCRRWLAPACSSHQPGNANVSRAQPRDPRDCRLFSCRSTQGGRAGLPCPERSRREPLPQKTTARSAFLCAASPAACTRLPALESTDHSDRRKGTHSPLPIVQFG